MRHGESAANVFDRGGERPEDGGDRLTEHWAVRDDLRVIEAVDAVS